MEKIFFIPSSHESANYFLGMCSESMASAHVIFKYINSLVHAVFTREFLHLCAFSKSNIYLIATPKGPTWPLVLHCFNWCVFWFVRILLGPKKSTNQGPGVKTNLKVY